MKGWPALALGVLMACQSTTPPPAIATTTPKRTEPTRSEKRGRIVVTETQVEILDPIRFLTGSTTLDPRSTRILDAIASTLTGNPSIKLVAVHAYGVDQLAQFQARIGAERAQAIVDQLVARGVARNRLLAHGQAQPPPGMPAGPSLEILRRDP